MVFLDTILSTPGLLAPRFVQVSHTMPPKIWRWPTDAKCGMMLWEGKSKGTLNNPHQLINAGKKRIEHFLPIRWLHGRSCLTLYSELEYSKY
jgi:hypothetical protein